MSTEATISNGVAQHWIVGRVEASGEFTAEVVGVPDLRATAATRDDAIASIRQQLGEWVATGRLMSIEVPATNRLLEFGAHLDPNDPLEKEFLEELARKRREDLEQTLHEDQLGCSNTSSTLTT